MTGIEPSLFTAGMRLLLAQTRATSSMTMHVASASAPMPPYSSPPWGAWKSPATRASSASLGKRFSWSTDAAWGAICFSAMVRIAWRSSS